MSASELRSRERNASNLIDPGVAQCSSAGFKCRSSGNDIVDQPDPLYAQQVTTAKRECAAHVQVSRFSSQSGLGGCFTAALKRRWREACAARPRDLTCGDGGRVEAAFSVTHWMQGNGDDKIRGPAGYARGGLSREPPRDGDRRRVEPSKSWLWILEARDPALGLALVAQRCAAAFERISERRTGAADLLGGAPGCLLAARTAARCEPGQGVCAALAERGVARGWKRQCTRAICAKRRQREVDGLAHECAQELEEHLQEGASGPGAGSLATVGPGLDAAAKIAFDRSEFRKSHWLDRSGCVADNLAAPGGRALFTSQLEQTGSAESPEWM